MELTTHERPGVYSAYDASTVVSGSGGGKVAGLAALVTGETDGTLVRVSLADGSRSEIASFTLENGVNYFLVGVSGGRFVMKRITADTSTPDPVKTQRHELFLVDKQGRVKDTLGNLALILRNDPRLKDIVSKENRDVLWSFLVAQTFNIVVTFLIACLLFGILKPAL